MALVETASPGPSADGRPSDDITRGGDGPGNDERGDSVRSRPVACDSAVFYATRPRERWPPGVPSVRGRCRTRNAALRPAS